MFQYQANAAACAIIKRKPANLFDFLKNQYAADLRPGIGDTDFCKPLAWVFPDYSTLLFYRGRPNSLVTFRSLARLQRCLQQN